MRIVIAFLIVLLGAAGGLGLGVMLRPAADAGPPPAAPQAGGDDAGAGAEPGAAKDGAAKDGAANDGAAHGGPGSPAGPTHGADAPGDRAARHGSGPAPLGDDPAGEGRSYVKFTRELIVPLVAGGQTQALMLFDLALDVPADLTERAYAAEPRLLDAFLGELFAMSSTGAFASDYTGERVVAELRDRLRAAARRSLGEGSVDVLIFDIMRQEL